MSPRVYALIEMNHQNKVATITLNNPARRNAIGPQVINELLYTLENAALDNKLHSIVITG
ncbi:MAG: enoyl-CoA hydratase, partial [Deltaproteobacteria bacterium]